MKVRKLSKSFYYTGFGIIRDHMRKVKPLKGSMWVKGSCILIPKRKKGYHE